MRPSKKASKQAEEVRAKKDAYTERVERFPQEEECAYNSAPHRLDTAEIKLDRATRVTPDTFPQHRPILETKDFILRPQHSEDLHYMTSYQRDPLMMRYFGGPVTAHRAKKRLNLARWHQHAFGYSIFTVIRKPNNHFAGFAGLIHLNFDFSEKDTELVVCLTQPNWDHNLARQLTYALLDYAFNTLGKPHVLLRFQQRSYPLTPVLTRDLKLERTPTSSIGTFNEVSNEIVTLLPELMPSDYTSNIMTNNHHNLQAKKASS